MKEKWGEYLPRLTPVLKSGLSGGVIHTLVANEGV